MKAVMRTVLSYILLNFMFAASFSLTACAQLRSNKQESVKSGMPAAAPAVAPIPQEPLGIKKGGILLVYPRGENNNKINAASTFIVGAVPPGRTLLCNGKSVYTNSEGFFGQAVKLNYGKNNFLLQLSGQEAEPMTVVVERPAPPATLSSTTFNILPESIEPKDDISVVAGDIIQFAARATPLSSMFVQVGARNIPMKPAVQGKKASVNLGLATAFGVSFQHSPAMKDLYLAYYKVQAQDNWNKLVPTFVLQKGKKQIKARAKGSLTLIRQPKLMQTAHNDTIVRLGPGAARITPLPEAVRLLCDGAKGEWLRLEYFPGKHVWINRNDLAVEEDSSALPQSRVSTINMDTDGYGARIAVPLNQRLPFQIEQDLAGKKLILRIFGATADTDFVTSDLHPANESACAKMIDYVSWKQKGDLHYELTAHLLNKQQWGFYADYEDNTLVLHIKSAPRIDLASASLKGAIICVDPGHGGRETGSIGCSGIKEATVNFAIADKLRQELERAGASVIMTRTSDTDVSLQQRVDTAADCKADLLLSVHNNALPDGRDPLSEHGTSSYWYHPQSIEFARLAQKELVMATGLKDYGSRYQNLALCRPTRMPAVLMEIAFMINPDELSKLIDPQFQELAAKSIAESCRKFLIEKVNAEQPSLP